MRSANRGSRLVGRLSVDRAFVIQFSTNIGLGMDRLNGRVEHIVSGEAGHFGSPADLLGFMEGVLARVSETEAPG